MNRLILFVIYVVIVSAELVHAMPSESRFSSVEKLLTVSSAARQIDESGDVSAKHTLDTARQKFQQARIAAKNGDDTLAESLLDEAAKLVFTATRMLKKDESLIQKDLRDFDDRMSSIDALCDAYHNIRKEKDLGDPKSSELYPVRIRPSNCAH